MISIFVISNLENYAPPSKKSKKGTKGKGKTSKNTANQSKLTLSYLLQTHSKNNDPKDTKTKVWMCEFEPNAEQPGKTTNIVATCGGDSICFIDCDTGMVVKKYKEIGEEFYCICWTVIRFKNELTGFDRKVSMLAAAGVKGDIKLIDTFNLVCFKCVSHHKKPVDALLFHPVEQNWMFSKYFLNGFSVLYFSSCFFFVIKNCINKNDYKLTYEQKNVLITSSLKLNVTENIIKNIFK